MKIQSKDWFADWFDTSYYHTLYKNRDTAEAEQFIRRLIQHLPLKEGDRVLDLACGKGRHAVTLSECGFDVLGVDLSQNSITDAKKLERDSLKFAVHDMRNVIKNEQFDGIFNLFTSFGYFEAMEDNQRTVNSIAQMLRPNGLLIIDFMNAHRVISNLVETESKTVDEITFHIQRRFDGTHIYKDINFEADGRQHSFTERVQGLKKNDFVSLLSNANFEILHDFGNFNLDKFEENSSDRLIIIAQLKPWN